MGDPKPAVEFQMTKITIGLWSRNSVNPEDLVARCCFVEKMVIWEILADDQERCAQNLSRRIVIEWDDFLSLKLSNLSDGTGVVEVELRKPPIFFRKNTASSEHLPWKEDQDFTLDNSASTFRRHTLHFASGVLQKIWDKIQSGDKFWSELVKKPFPSLQNLYFNDGSNQSQEGFGHVEVEHGNLNMETQFGEMEALIGGRSKRSNQKAQARSNAEAKKKAEAESSSSSSQSDVQLSFQQNKIVLGSGGIGAKFKRQNAQKQAKIHAQEKQNRETIQPILQSNEEVFREKFGISTIIRDWSVIQGIIGDVLKQKKAFCWAIVLARLMQAIYNQGLPIAQQYRFSFLELVGHIKPKENENFSLANLKVAFDHITVNGMLKKPIREYYEKVSAKGVRVKKTFDLYEDVDASFIRAKLDKYPVGLNLEVTLDFGYITEEIYYLPKKGVITVNTKFHCILLIGYGMTRQGKLYFIGQNSWGIAWGCRGYVRIIINDKCDIFCLKE